MKVVAAVLLLVGGAALADEPPASRIPVELRSCVGLERNTERLACFDRGIAALLGADGAAAPSVESSFGLTASTPRVDAIRNPELSEDITKVTSRVTAVAASNDGSAVVTLDNGQVWRQISGGQLLLKAGDEVEISRAALGSFQMKVPSGRSGKVKRVR
jgi:hypothetical protein